MTSKSRGTATILAAGMLALLALTLPARAAGDPAPQPDPNSSRHTSIDSGWSALNKLVAADYDRAIDPAASSVALTNRDGATLPGALDVDAKDASILTFRPYQVMTESAAPYTVIFTAHGLNQDPALADTVTTRTFKIDTLVPRISTIVADKPVVLPADANVIVGGQAVDIGQSGVSRVDLLFYNPQATAPRTDAVQGLTLSQAFECSNSTCPAAAEYSFTITDLPIGVWTVRAVAFDAAGNKSAESDFTQFAWTKPSA